MGGDSSVQLKLVLIVFSIGLALEAFGADVCADVTQLDQASNPIDEFDNLVGSNVLGDTACRTAFCSEVADWTALKPSVATAESAAGLLDTLRQSAETLPTGEDGVQELNEMLAKWQVSMAETDVASLDTATWQPDRFVVFPGHPQEVNLEQTFLNKCPDSISQCPETFSVATCVYTHVVLQRRILVKLLEENRDATLAYLERLNQRWVAFNSGGRSLFPWELAINGALIARRSDKRGFIEPPTRQIAILHPSIGVSGQDAADGDFEEVMILEVVGWYGWRWGGRDGATMKRPFGASVIADWNGSNAIGYGVMVHLPKNWSVGVTHHSSAGNSETSVLVSIDLGKLLFREQELRNTLIDRISQIPN